VKPKQLARDGDADRHLVDQILEARGALGLLGEGAEAALVHMTAGLQQQFDAGERAFLLSTTTTTEVSDLAHT
jgi:hypothetical protein